jgi:Peptidase MA superfamily
MTMRANLSRRAAPGIFVALLGALSYVAAMATPVNAAPVVVVSSEEVSNNFPGGIEWRINFNSGGQEVQGALRYKFEPFGITSTAQTECGPDGCTALLEYPGDLYIPPYTRITYFWEIEDGDLESSEPADPVITPEQQFVYVDNRFEWQTLSQDPVELHYYSSNESEMRELLEASEGTVEYWADLFGVDINFPVNVVVYQDLVDLQGALPLDTAAGENGIVTCGQQSASDIVVVAFGGCTIPSEDILRHELTHLVVEEALRGPFGDIPLWINEGAAVYSQESPGSYEAAVNAAIRQDDLLTIRQISSAPGDPERVLQFYGQSWALVTYLIEEYGEEAFGELFAMYRDGTTDDAAFEEVYGFDLNGLEDEWRQSVGLEPINRDLSSAEDETGENSEVSESAVGDDGGDSKLLPALIVGGVTLGLVAVLVIGGVYLTHRMSKPAA